MFRTYPDSHTEVKIQLFIENVELRVEDEDRTFTDEIGTGADWLRDGDEARTITRAHKKFMRDVLKLMERGRLEETIAEFREVAQMIGVTTPSVQTRKRRSDAGVPRGSRRRRT